MINFYNQVPAIYVNTSRDFQYLSWLINIVLNSVKHNVDSLYSLPNTKTDPRLTELLALTLGFKIKRNYDQAQLSALVSIMPSILKCKGTKKAIEMACEALITAAGTVGDFKCTIEKNNLEVILPRELIDVTLLIDLLPYILPAGMTCRIIRKTQISGTPKTELTYSDTLKAKWVKDIALENLGRKVVGLSTMYNPDTNNPEAAFEYSNFKQGQTDAGEVYDDFTKVNAGLLDNTVIPVAPSQINIGGVNKS